MAAPEIGVGSPVPFGRLGVPARPSCLPGHWKYHIKTILVDRNVEDVAIVGLSGNKCVWATKPGGLLAAISPQEVGLITGQDRKTFLLTGVTVADKKCRVICDNLLVDEDNMMDVRSKGSDSRNICIGKTPKALIFLMGKKGVHRGALNQKVHSMIEGTKA
ncbi:profilin-3 [Gavia stellata]|uniref:profilin-3 n=1 Tax=Gavia stellata TaxID=37040 RepID=UPI00289F8D72|nr:profilin-3 [Gavia stellata]